MKTGEAIQELTSQYIDQDSMEDTWDLDGLSQSIYNDFMISLDLESIVNQDDSLNADNIWKVIYEEFTRNCTSGWLR